MRKLRGATLGLLGGIAGAIVLGGLTSAGCSSDNTSTGDGGGSSSSSSGSGSSGASSSSSGGTSSSSSSSGGHDGGSSSSGSSSSSSSSGGGSSSSSSSGGSSSSSSSGSGGGDGGDGGDGGTTGEGGPPCVTTTVFGSDGGMIPVGDGGAQLLFSFDNVTTVPSGWSTGVTDPADSGLAGTLSINTTEGKTCPGSLQLSIPFTAIGQQVTAHLFEPFPGGTPFTGTQFHAWVKVEIPGDAGITVAQEFLQGNGQAYAQWGLPDAAPYTAQNFVNFYPPNATDWHEVLIPLAGCAQCGGDGGTPIAFQLDQLGGTLLYNNLDAGAAPTTAILLIDDIWLE